MTQEEYCLSLPVKNFAPPPHLHPFPSLSLPPPQLPPPCTTTTPPSLLALPPPSSSSPMEERVPPPPLPPPPHRDDHRHPVPDLPPPPRYRNSTYGVQVPKDQIYRVPPPEHAAFIERYCTGSVARQRSPCSSCFCSALCFAFLLSFLGAVLYLVVQPSLPQFSITNVSIGHPAWSSSQRRPSNPNYEFTMKADYGNPVMSVQYYRGGSASLIHKGQGIASGQISHFDQNAAESTPFRITFTGKDSLPLELQ